MTTLTHKSPSIQERHLTDASRAQRRRMGALFERAAHTPVEALDNARAMIEALKNEGRWHQAPTR